MKQSHTKLNFKNQNIMDANLRVSEWLFSQITSGRKPSLELLLEAQKIERQMIIDAFNDGQMHELLNKSTSRQYTSPGEEYFSTTFENYAD